MMFCCLKKESFCFRGVQKKTSLEKGGVGGKTRFEAVPKPKSSKEMERSGISFDSFGLLFSLFFCVAKRSKKKARKTQDLGFPPSLKKRARRKGKWGKKNFKN